ncbi:MAG: hypothetical protein C0480_13920 [Bradyrhizobium sp.]|nr:hypothetical protein [Bradyrhizobium sp.]
MISASLPLPHSVSDRTGREKTPTILFYREIRMNAAAPNVTQMVSSRDGNARKKCTSHRNDAIAFRTRLMSGAVCAAVCMVAVG